MRGTDLVEKPREKDHDCDEEWRDENPTQYEAGPAYVTEKGHQGGETMASVNVRTVQPNQLNEISEKLSTRW